MSIFDSQGQFGRYSSIYNSDVLSHTRTLREPFVKKKRKKNTDVRKRKIC